jgi:Flp pilus assembly pilin Flp
LPPFSCTKIEKLPKSWNTGYPRNDIVKVVEPFPASGTKEPSTVTTLQMMRPFLDDESGQYLIKYAPVAALVAPGAVSATNSVIALSV